MFRRKFGGVLAIIAALSAAPVLAADANFESLNLSVGFPPSKGVTTGYTNGSVSLSSIQKTDSRNNPCIGFGSPTPDHIIVLQKDFSRLSFQVDTQGKDTTIVIKGPNDLVLCGDDTGSSKDASVQASNLKAGKYSVWVGSIETGQQWNYTLSVKQ